MPWPELPGINTTVGLSRIGGNRASYLALLKKFQQSHAQAIQEIRAALEQEDLTLAARLAHTIKGVSGNVGADQLYAAARELEMAIKQGAREVWDARIDQLQQALTQVISAIQVLVVVLS